MKKFLILAVALCLNSSLSATNSVNPDSGLIHQIFNLLDDLPIEIQEELRAEVKFYVDSQSRLQVLAVNVDDPYLKKLLKKRLDNKLVEFTGLEENVYKLPLRITL